MSQSIPDGFIKVQIKPYYHVNIATPVI